MSTAEAPASLPHSRSVPRDRDVWAHLYEGLALSSQSLDVVLQTVAEEICSMLEGPVTIFVAGQTDALHPVGIADTDPERVEKTRQVLRQNPPQVGHGTVGLVALHRQTAFIREGVHEPPPESFTSYQTFVAATGLNSMLASPMLVEGRLLGVVGVGRFGADPPFSEEDIPTLEKLADLIGRLVLLSFRAEHGRVAESALNTIPEAVIAVDHDHKVTFWSAGAERLFEYHMSETLGREVTELLGPGATMALQQQRETPGDSVAHTAKPAWEQRAILRSRSGGDVVVEMRGAHMPGDEAVGWATGEYLEGADTSVEPGGTVLVLRNIATELQAERDLKRQERLAQAALDASPMLTAVVENDDTVLAANTGWERRVDRETGRGKDINDAVAVLLPDPEAQKSFRDHLARVRKNQATRSHRDYDVRIARQIHSFSIYLSFIGEVGVLITIEDITERAARERALSFEATHDLLTRLPNQAVLIQRAAEATERAALTGDRVGLMFCDIDGFKELNDVHGHATGDSVLACFAERLEASCRSSDTVARLHGDEFAVLVVGTVDFQTVQAIASRIVGSLAEPVATPSGPVSASISVGAVVFRPDPHGGPATSDVQNLLAQADAAMYEAKRRGKNRWVMHDEMIQS